MGMKQIMPAEKLDAQFTAPPSKAHTLRALFIAGLAEGKSILRNALNAEDQQVAARAISLFGPKIRFDGKDFVVQGTGGKLKAPKQNVFTANSGVTTRFIVPFAGLAEGDSVIEGDARMGERPISGLVDALSQTGMEAKCAENGCPPVKVKGGTFLGGKATVKGQNSSQFLSAMLICAPCTEKGLLVKMDGELKSKPYIDITLECMKAFGCPVVNRSYKEFFVAGKGKYKAREFEIEGDYSSASYFFAAAAMTGGKVRVKNLKEASSQGDKVFLDFLRRMGCVVKFGENFVQVQGADLKGISVDMANCPDIVPSLAVVAAFAQGKTTIKNIGHLAVKESNRLQSVAQNLESCGVRVRAGADLLEITGSKPHGTEIDTFNDHRIAMAFSAMGLAVPGIKIRDEKSVAKSFPNFFEELENAYGA